MNRLVSFIAVIILFAVILTGCSENKDPKESSEDYSKYSFVDIAWTRDTEYDVETIYFGKDGSFRYYCACGNPVNDSDLCEGYAYDDATKTITLDCIETTDEMVTVIKLLECDGTILHLDFNGEIRNFEK